MLKEPKDWSDDDIARIIGNRAIAHLRTMYPQVYAATCQSCRTSLRNHIRNDVVALMRAIRGDGRAQQGINECWPDADTPDEKALPELPKPREED